MDLTGRPAHHRYADYFWGVAAELAEGDGFRLTPADGRNVPIDLDRPLVAVRVEQLGDLVSVTLIDRSSMVHEALGNLPDGVAEVADAVVFSADERVLIRW